MRETKFGRFSVSSGRICVTDPVYNERTPTDKVIVNHGHLGLYDVAAKNGNWRFEIRYHDAGELWGERVAELFAYHIEFSPNGTRMLVRMPYGVGVDSGYAGVFDAAQYTNHSTDTAQFPDGLRETLDEDLEFGSTDYGAFCSSGIGDGVYPVYAKYSDDNAVAIRVDFTAHPLLSS